MISPQVPRAARSIASGSHAWRERWTSLFALREEFVRSQTPKRCWRAGAEKISVNSPALEDPELIDALSERFGAQCVVVGIDSQTIDGDYRVQQFTGDLARTRDTARGTLDWVD